MIMMRRKWRSKCRCKAHLTNLRMWAIAQRIWPIGQTRGIWPIAQRLVNRARVWPIARCRLVKCALHRKQQTCWMASTIAVWMSTSRRLMFSMNCSRSSLCTAHPSTSSRTRSSSAWLASVSHTPSNVHPHLSALEVRFSRRGAIQIYVYMYLYLYHALHFQCMQHNIIPI